MALDIDRVAPTMSGVSAKSGAYRNRRETWTLGVVRRGIAGLSVRSFGGRLAALVVALSTLMSAPSVAAVSNSVTQADSLSATNAALWPTSLADEQQLSAFEDGAKAAGALGFYRDEATSSLVVLLPAAKSAGFDLAELGPVSVPVTIKVSDLDPAAITLAQDKLRSLPEEQLAAGKSMGFFFNPKTEKIEVTTTIDAAELATALGDSWPLIDYRQGSVMPAGRFNDAAPLGVARPSISRTTGKRTTTARPALPSATLRA